MSQVQEQDAARVSAQPAPFKQPSLTLRTARRIRPVLWIVYAGALIMAAIAAAGVLAVIHMRERALTDAERELQNVAAVFRQNFEHTFQEIELTQIGVSQHLQALKIASVDEFESRMSGPDTQLTLKDRIANLLPVHALLLASARGKVINYSRDWPSTVESVADQEYFKALASATGPSTYIGVPAPNLADGEWCFYVARTIVGRNGEFLGLLVAVMRLKYFEQLFATLDLGHGSSIALTREDGKLLVRYPSVDMASAPSFAGNPLFRTALPKFGKGVVHLYGFLNQAERIIAGQRLVNYPAAVTVGINLDTVLADWRKGTLATVGIGALALLVIGGMAFLCARQVGKVLARQRDQLKTALDHMSHGLCVFDAAGTLVLHNPRYLEIFNIPPGVVAPGRTLREILARMEGVGILTGDHEKYVADLRSVVAQRRTTRSLRTLEDGRTISVKNEPLPDGGWVATHEDITELKRREDELRLENMKFDAALQNMSQGLVMFDHEGRLMVCNRRYAQLYGLPSHLIQPGITRERIWEHRIAAGFITPAKTADYIRERIAKARPGTPFSNTVELPDGRIILVSPSAMPNGGWVATHEDITARRQAEAQIAHMAHHDALTSLPNRVLLRERLEEALGHVRRGGQLAVLYLDLDHFKSINDTLGHGIGDELLKSVALRLRGCVRDIDTIARLGGDEFAVIQTELTDPSDAAALAARIREAITQPYDLEGHQVPADVSIGISLAPNDAIDPDQLLKNADMALYKSKADGRGTFRFFEPGMDERVKARRALELDLRNAIVSGEFVLHYQPLVNIARNEVSCFETLLRWRHPRGGMIPPAEFIPIAEETGLINQIGEWVLREACREAAGWPDDVAVAVNLSPVQFKNNNLPQVVVGALAAAGLSPRRLELEITEAVLLQNNEATLATLRQLHALGIRIAMDDFGTGYSSLSYLRSFPFDKIKIDRSFIGDLAEKAESDAIVQAITGLANRLQITTTAEGVETQEQLAKVEALGCTEMQGFLYSRPVPASGLAAWFSGRELKAAGAA
jgi:diguanylate cyclase (GGDEF)-like protein